jgi:hypothetical protein
MTMPDEILPDHVRRNREAWDEWPTEEVWIARKRG